MNAIPIPPKCLKVIKKWQRQLERFTDEEAELISMWVCFTVVHSISTRRDLTDSHAVTEHLKVSYNKFCDDINQGMINLPTKF